MKKWIMVFLKGMGMGAADVIPGVSGGTIAFITGIYERLITAIKNVNWPNIKLFFTGHFKEFWKNIDGTFLLCLIAGIITSFLSLAKLMTYLLENQPVLVWAFFFGLIMASTLFIGKDVKWNWKTVLTFCIFAVLSYIITSPQNQPLNATDANWYIFICGAIAICAMILPGISGSFILILMGHYYTVMGAIKGLTGLKDVADNLRILGLFFLGIVFGLASFAQLLSWMFKHLRDLTIVVLAGFMIGSLRKIWPWKFGDDFKGGNVLPELDGRFWIAVALAVGGFALVIAIELAARYFEKRQKSADKKSPK